MPFVPNWPAKAQRTPEINFLRCDPLMELNLHPFLHYSTHPIKCNLRLALLLLGGIRNEAHSSWLFLLVETGL